MVDHRMRPPLQRKKHEGYDSQGKLKPLRTLFLRTQRLKTPLRCGTTAQAPLPPKNIQIEERSRQSDRHHGNADCVAMKSFGGRVRSGGNCECTQAYQHPNPADGEHSRTQALQQREDEAGPVHQAGSAIHRLQRRAIWLRIRLNFSRFHSQMLSTTRVASLK